MKVLKVVILWMAFFLHGAVFANYACVGSVYGVTLSPKGRVAVQDFGQMEWVYFCSITPENDGSFWNDVPPDACKAMYTILLTAQLTERQIRVWFDDDVDGLPSDCSKDRHPRWQLLDSMYFGPELLD